MQKVYIGATQMMGKSVLWTLLDSHPQLHVNPVHSPLGTFLPGLAPLCYRRTGWGRNIRHGAPWRSSNPPDATPPTAERRTGSRLMSCHCPEKREVSFSLKPVGVVDLSHRWVKVQRYLALPLATSLSSHERNVQTATPSRI